MPKENDKDESTKESRKSIHLTKKNFFFKHYRINSAFNNQSKRNNFHLSND